eukprot:2580883-Pyramimonas_sp.AAC.1
MSCMRQIVEICDCIDRVCDTWKCVVGRRRPSICVAMVNNHLMCMHVHSCATLNGAGRRTSR